MRRLGAFIVVEEQPRSHEHRIFPCVEDMELMLRDPRAFLLILGRHKRVNRVFEHSVQVISMLGFIIGEHTRACGAHRSTIGLMSSSVSFFLPFFVGMILPLFIGMSQGLLIHRLYG